MKVTFKDVGQGDSIILEWSDGGVGKIGIIDCNKKQENKTNPVLDYVKLSTYTEIEFIILSHPHKDHFSGMVELLNYIESKNIIVKVFGHSLWILGAEFYHYIDHFEGGDYEAKFLLRSLLYKVNDLRKKDIILKMEFIFEKWRTDLNESTYLKCLSPSQNEAEIYNKIVAFESGKNKLAASSAANHLSTLFKLVINNKYVLLTADTEVPTFERIIKENNHVNLLRMTLDVGQIPHHGSSANYSSAFWDHITKGAKPHAVVSAGDHLTYKHPHFPVLKAFHLKGFSVSSTSVLYGMEEYIEYLQRIAKISATFDTFSVHVAAYTGGDKVFEIT